MGKYQIKVNVKIVECLESEPGDLLKQEDGGFILKRATNYDSYS